MTRIHGAGAYPTPPALDSAAGVAATSRPSRAPRSKGDSPLSPPGAPDVLTARPSANAASRTRIASSRLFAEQGAPDNVSRLAEHGAGVSADAAPQARARDGADDQGSGRQAADSQADVDAVLFITISQLCRAGNDRLDPMFTFRLRGSPSSLQALLFRLAAHPRMAAGTGGAWPTYKAQSLQNLIATAGLIGMPVVLYCDVDATADPCADRAGEAVHPARLEALFALPATRGTTILWSRCGGVGRFLHKPVEHADCLRAILQDPQMRHIHIDLSWSRVARQIMLRTGADGKDVPDHASVRAWARLINDHPDRFLFGSDALNARERAAAWKAIGALYQPLLETLTPAARGAVMTGNYARLVLDAQPKMRAFAQHVLTPAFVEQDLRAWENGCRNDGEHFSPDALRAARDAAYAGAGVDVNGKPLA